MEYRLVLFALTLLFMPGPALSQECVCRVVMVEGDSEKELGRFSPTWSEGARSVKTYSIQGSDHRLAAYVLTDDPGYESFVTKKGINTIEVDLALSWGTLDQWNKKEERFVKPDREVTGFFGVPDSADLPMSPIWHFGVEFGNPPLNVSGKQVDFVLECEVDTESGPKKKK